MTVFVDFYVKLYVSHELYVCCNIVLLDGTKWNCLKIETCSLELLNQLHLITYKRQTPYGREIAENKKH